MMVNSIENALVVDDDALMREFVVETLRRNSIKITEVSNGLEAKKRLDEQDFDMAFIDLKMPGMSGMELLQYISSNGLNTLPVLITAFGTVEKAVEAMRIGAYDFLMKPFSPEQVELIINRARDLAELQAQNAYLKEELGWILPKGRKIVGTSPAITRMMRDVAQVAASSATVLITGESGTGKELVALAIHSMSANSNSPFVRMNCAAVPETLMDSELFGHERGAFTSAITRRVGRFELAGDGSLLLDEISEMQVGLQAKLLRVLQEREFERVGGTRTIQTQCRVIASTNRNLKEYVDDGKFREDLYYRLNVVPIHIPPLRERVEDVPLMADSFIQRFSRRRTGDAPRFSDEALGLMQAYTWPGNVRELENLVERLCVMEDGSVFKSAMLPLEIRMASGAAPSAPCVRTPVVVEALPQDDEPTVELEVEEKGRPEQTEEEVFLMAEVERRTIIKALRASSRNRSQAAEMLGISIRTLRNKLNQYRTENTLPAEFV